MPAKRLITLHTPRIAHLVAVLVMLMASASVMVAPDAPVNRHTPRGPYDHIILDSIDAGLAAALPAPVYQVVQQVMRVVAQPAEVVRNARQQVGLDHHAAQGNQAAAHASSFLDGFLFLALIGGSVVGVMIRILVRLAQKQR